MLKKPLFLLLLIVSGLFFTNYACGPTSGTEVNPEVTTEISKEVSKEVSTEPKEEKIKDSGNPIDNGPGVKETQPDSEPSVNVCEKYCDNVTANCSGKNQVYPDKAACMAACKNMPEGKPGDTSGNTAHCRAYHAGGPAKGAPETHCPHAGISSDGDVCGTACEAYCDQVTANCSGGNAQHKDKAACMTWCKGKPAGKWDDKGGDTIACRAYHASFPAAGDAKTHCPHAGTTGGGVCGDKKPASACGLYCDNVTANCSGKNQVYPDKAACMAACKNMPEGKPGDTAGNTVHCRAYHAGGPAKGAPETHCPHAGISSDSGVCGSRCEAYCDQVTANCSGGNAQHKDKAACMTWCKGKPSGKWDDKGGDTIACRAYHASFPAAGDAKAHCGHAGKTGDGVCAAKPASACALYCDNAMKNCTGANQIYATRANCMDSCKNMPEGKPGDTSGNTVHCRAYHAGGPAKTAPATHCPHAGISSDSGVCGSPCEAYCDQVTANCSGGNAQHTDKAACMTWCKGKTPGKWDDKGGNTIACRAYHASFPAAGAPATHCGHAGKTGDKVCVDKGGALCATYCNNVMANCTGKNQVYAKRADCFAACGSMTEGKAGDTSGNTVYCRAYHAGAPAKSDPATHCPHAGISSDSGVCGSPCEAYCEQVTVNCSGANAQHTDKAACMTWCKGKPNGKWNATSGNSIACRAYHASFPAAADAKTHCPHAGKSGAGVCVVTACDIYCGNVMKNCTGGNKVYGTMDSCMAACKSMPVGKPGDTSGNTVYCRAYHAGAPAKGAPATHCPHAGISSDSGVCGSRCEAYCDQVTANCSGGNAQHKDKAACMTWCKGKPNGKWDDKGGDTIACRAYHASFPAAADAATHCPHAGKTGANVCVYKSPPACILYCDNVMKNCTGGNQVYTTKASCLSACKNMPVGKSSDTSGNTAYCRAYHAGAPAKATPKAHCPHAGVSSDSGICGSPCEAYCDQVTANCRGANAQHTDKAACMTWCKGKPNGQWDDTSGNTIACRAYHASFPAAASATTHCPHAGKTGSGVCVDKPSAACVLYCGNVMKNCTGGNQVYTTKANCYTACKNMPVGKSSDTAGNTAYCRAYHAGAPAQATPKAHCPHAGISSDSGVCGSRCEAYCDQVTANCRGGNAQHTDKAACMTWCKGKAAGAWNATSGNSVACRAYHASFPAAGDAKTHCPHAGKTGANVCK